MTNMVRLVRRASLVFAVVLLCGGYAAHQYFLFQGGEAFTKWSQGIAGPNLMVGWILLVLAVVLSFVKDEEEEDA